MDLASVLGKAKIQRALLRDLPGSLYGEAMDLAHYAGLIERRKWFSTKGKRTYRAFVRRTDLWDQAASAVADARRSLNLAVDPTYVGSHSERKKVPGGTGYYRIWHSVWSNGESPTSLKNIGVKAAAALTPETK